MESQSYLYLVFSTCFGYCALIYRTNPFLVSRLILPRLNKNEIFERLDKNGAIIRQSHEKVFKIKKRIADYFKGIPIQTPFEWLDMKGFTDLQKKVLTATSNIEYGNCCSYKEIAANIGRPKACRFVGNTLAINPFPILIPCHRVIRSDLTTGQFRGGTDLKRKLIEHEARTVKSKTQRFFQPLP